MLNEKELVPFMVAFRGVEGHPKKTPFGSPLEKTHPHSNVLIS